MTLFSTSTMLLNLFMEIILSHMTYLLSFLLFIHFFPTEYLLLIETSLLRSYVLFFFLFLFIINFYLRGFTVNARHMTMTDIQDLLLSKLRVENLGLEKN
jgi:hypothetical protein